MTLCDLGVGATAVGSRIPVFLRSCWVWEAVDWKLIETHWSDLLRAAIPNREDALSSVSAMATRRLSPMALISTSGARLALATAGNRLELACSR